MSTTLKFVAKEIRVTGNHSLDLDVIVEIDDLSPIINELIDLGEVVDADETDEKEGWVDPTDAMDAMNSILHHNTIEDIMYYIEDYKQFDQWLAKKGYVKKDDDD